MNRVGYFTYFQRHFHFCIVSTGPKDPRKQRQFIKVDRMFLRRLSHPFALWAPPNSNAQSEDLSPRIKDIVFEWQLGSKDFTRLDESTLLRAEICSSPSHAKRVLRAACKAGIIDPITGRPDTKNVGSGMVKALAILSMPKQRELVMLLFFWEEEIVRWEAFTTEEREFETRLLEVGMADGVRNELECMLGAARAKKRVAPSKREAYGAGEQLPAYSERET